MTFDVLSRNWTGRIFFHVILGSIVILSVSQYSVEADEVPAFFLKIAKNIPRVGRSGDKFDDLLLNSPKNIPGRGRHGDNVKSSESWQSHEDFESFAKPIKRRIDYSPLDPAESWSWQHFPLAIEGPKELWRTLAGYSKDPLEDNLRKPHVTRVPRGPGGGTVIEEGIGDIEGGRGERGGRRGRAGGGGGGGGGGGTPGTSVSTEFLA
ncbi:ecdysis triggering hormone preproprotein [Vespula squamosa]|uniref:Ecdysis triggering hormone preproprotein n=1 Tax=Vespula squamosa TaxID=30214 RepID=A0ABD1ZYA3_VESSQ